MKKYSLLLIIIAGLAACGDDKKTACCDPSVKCIDHLKGQTFELYRIDTQSFRMSDNKPSGQRGSIMIDSNSSNYKAYVYSAAGDSLTIKRKSFSSTRSFRITKDTAYWGDDAIVIQTCSENDYSGSEFDASAIPDCYLKVTGLTKRKK